MVSMKLTSHGFWSHSKEFLAAADVYRPVRGKDGLGDSISLVAYYLIGHSIELSLKSYLYSKGYTEKTLRHPKKFGHNLSNLLAECRRRKLGREVKLTRYEIKAINVLSDTYKSKKFEYIEYGTYRAPKYFFIRDVAEKLVNGLRRYAMNSSFNK